MAHFRNSQRRSGLIEGLAEPSANAAVGQERELGAETPVQVLPFDLEVGTLCELQAGP